MTFTSELWSIQTQKRFYDEHQDKSTKLAFEHATQEETSENNSSDTAKKEFNNTSANVNVKVDVSNKSVSSLTSDNDSDDNNEKEQKTASLEAEDNTEVSEAAKENAKLKLEKSMNKLLSNYRNTIEEIDKMLPSMENIDKASSSLVENHNQQNELRQLEQELENVESAIPYQEEKKRIAMLWRWPTKSWSAITVFAKYLRKHRNLKKAQWLASLTLLATVLMGAFSAFIYCIYWLTSSSFYLTAGKELIQTMLNRKTAPCDYAIITNRWTKSQRLVEFIELPSEITNTHNVYLAATSNDDNQNRSGETNSVIEGSNDELKNNSHIVHSKTVANATYDNEITKHNNNNNNSNSTETNVCASVNTISDESNANTKVKWQLLTENKRHANDVTFVEVQDCNYDHVKLRVNWLLYKTQMYCHKCAVTNVIDLSPIFTPFRFARKHQISKKHSFANHKINETLSSTTNDFLSSEKREHFYMSHFLSRTRLLFNQYEHDTSHFGDKKAMKFTGNDITDSFNSNNDDDDNVLSKQQDREEYNLPKMLSAESIIRPLKQSRNSENANRGIVELAITRVVNEKIEQCYYNALVNKSLQEHKRMVYVEAMIANGTVNGGILTIKDVIPDFQLFEQDVLLAMQEAVKDVAIIY